MNPQDVRYIAVEGGGAGGLVTHPGVLEALESLQVIRNQNFLPIGVLGWAGSSSGSIISTLASSGYTSLEIASLASQEAMDMVFRLENYQLGEYATIEGGCISLSGQRAVLNPGMSTIISNAIANSDPVGAVADLAHATRALISHYLDTSTSLYNYFNTEQSNRIDAMLRDSQAKGIQRFKTLATEASREWGQRSARWRSPPSSNRILLDAEFPQVLATLAGLLIDHAAGKVTGASVFEILKHDFGIASGCVWRDYIDHLLAFAQFRVAFTTYLPSLDLPLPEDMKIVPTVEELFKNAIQRAIDIDYAGNQSAPYDFVEEYDYRRKCTFSDHAREFYGGQGANAMPPLIISGANITTQESHLFSAQTTPDFHIADAVRIATGLPPIFKPLVIEAADIPPNWPAETDRFGTGHYLEGLWVDGGLYYNSPFDVFKDVSNSFNEERYTMGIGAGLETRATMGTLTDFVSTFINMGYESNISSTRIDLENYLNINKFDIGIAKPTLLPKAMEYYRLDAYWRTYEFFNLNAGL